jgi:hypothetical protein
MPETSMHEDSFSLLWKNNIRTAWKFTIVEAITVS